MDGDELAFLAAICAAPADDLPRLVYADWLDEYGDADRAEFIRVQCELARLGPDCDKSHGRAGRRWCQTCINLAELRRRERELLRLHRLTWLSRPLMDIESETAGEACSFRRGFVAELTLPWAAWAECERALYWALQPCPGCGGKDWAEMLPADFHCHHCSGSGRVVPMMECLTCKGTKEIRYRAQYDPKGADFGNDGYTDPCPDCRDKGDEPTGRAPRPCPPTAQPVERVRLTTWPEGESGFTARNMGWVELVVAGDRVRVDVPPGGEVGPAEFLAARWPGVAFELPPPEPPLTGQWEEVREAIEQYEHRLTLRQRYRLRRVTA